MKLLSKTIKIVSFNQTLLRFELLTMIMWEWDIQKRKRYANIGQPIALGKAVTEGRQWTAESETTKRAAESKGGRGAVMQSVLLCSQLRLRKLYELPQGFLAAS